MSAEINFDFEAPSQELPRRDPLAVFSSALSLQNAVTSQLVDLVRSQQERIFQIQLNLSGAKTRERSACEDLADARADIEQLAEENGLLGSLLAETRDLIDGSSQLSPAEQVDLLDRIHEATKEFEESEVDFDER
ncbi:hypothetical protein WG936_05365 [Corynebacterium sp. H127]|uniref:hypothetical protein n=1 Tax=Corynebacterium sp. H127 TaxID=3133418 RepID=UPI0030AFD506